MSTKVTEVLDKTAREHGSLPAMRVKRGGHWEITTWTDYRKQVRQAGRAFMKLGLEPGQGVSIIGYNCPEWFIADVGAIAASGVPAGIYTTSTPDQCQYITDHCEAPVAVVEDAEQLAKYQKLADKLPRLKAVVQMIGKPPAGAKVGACQVLSWSEFLALGDAVPEADLDARIAKQKLDDVCTLIYTSGTTGPPKAVMITHENITWTAAAALAVLDGKAGDDVISYLPLSHIAEQVTSLHGPMLLAGCVWFAESMEKLGDNLREVHPHYFLGVPRVWEKIQAKVQAAGASNTGLKKKIAAWARGVGLAGGYADQKGQSRPFFWFLANKLVFSKVRERLGLDRSRLQITAAAPIARDTLEFFLSLGVPICEVYGMSECTGPATVSVPTKYRTGKAGFIMPGTELKIAEDGEICMRGKHVFKGYFKNPEATAEAIDKDGWLHSGDIGTIDKEGFLQITDRKKDLLITAGGENIAPQMLEGALKSIGVVSQAVVVGDREKYLAALLTLDPEKIVAVATAAGSAARDVGAAAKDEKFCAYIQKEIDRVNENLARVQTIKKWVIIPSEFTVEGGELTPTMKIKRKIIRDKYAAEIKQLYA